MRREYVSSSHNLERRIVFSRAAPLAFGLLLVVANIWAAQGRDKSARAWTVEDSVAVRYFVANSELPATLSAYNEPLVEWSPDRGRFFLISRRGNLQCDCNEYELQVFSAEHLTQVLHSSAQRQAWRPSAWRTVSVSSSHPNELMQGISDAKWLGNDDVLFMGVRGRGPRHLYRLTLDSGELHDLTPVKGDVFGYSLNAGSLVFKTVRFDRSNTLDTYPAVSVTGDELFQLAGAPSMVTELFVSASGATARALATFSSVQAGPWIAPDGKHAVFAFLPDSPDIPQEWSTYEVAPRRGQQTSMQFMLIDVQRQAFRPILNAPVGTVTRAGWHTQPDAIWSHDSRHVVLVNTALPVADDETRRAMSFVIDVDVTSDQWSIVDSLGGIAASSVGVALNDVSWDAQGLLHIPFTSGTTAGIAVYEQVAGTWRRRSTSALDRPMNDSVAASGLQVAIRENANEPAIPFATDGRHEVPLAVPDTAIRGLRRARVEDLEWMEPGNRKVRGGLMLPADGEPRHRLPLVIQAHHYLPNRFLPDGSATTAFAAQALASSGMAVLFLDIPTADKDAAWRSSVSGTIREGQAFVTRIDAAVEHLVARGLIDPRRIGLVGFSRSGLMTYYALTHPGRTKLAAAVIADGWSASYGEYVIDAATSPPGSSSHAEADEYYGGSFWQNKQAWLEYAPGFNVDRIRTPVLFTTTGRFNTILTLETLGAMRLTRRPYEYLVFPEGSHQLQTPRERQASLQATADWMCFWLQDKENEAAQKGDRFDRWRTIRANWNKEMAREAIAGSSFLLDDRDW
jgi:dipeptidyl aminopeptidase/acylaminoacyl peptidase